jgi:hypothetical protein
LFNANDSLPIALMLFMSSLCAFGIVWLSEKLKPIPATL